MSRKRPHTDASRHHMVQDMLEAARNHGTSYRNLPTSNDAEKVRQQLLYQTSIDQTFDWSGFVIGRKKNLKTNQIGVFITNDESRLPTAMRNSSSYNKQKLEAQVGYAVDILCNKRYGRICALPKLRSYKDAIKYLTDKCEERLGYPVEITVEQEPSTRGYHARIKRKED